MTAEHRRSRETWVDPRSWRVDARFGRAPVAGSVLRISTTHLDVAFAPGPTLPPVGRSGRIVLHGDAIEGPLTIRAMVGDRNDVADHLVMMGFVIRDADVPPELGALWQRSAIRVAIPEGSDMIAVVHAQTTAVTTRVRDLSSTGCRLEAPAAAELSLNSATAVRCAFHAADIERPISVPAHIQHRRYLGEGIVTYGVAFAQRQVPAIDDLLIRLQRASARARSDAAARARR